MLVTIADATYALSVGHSPTLRPFTHTQRLSPIPQVRIGHRTRRDGLHLLAHPRLEKPPDVHLQSCLAFYEYSDSHTPLYPRMLVAIADNTSTFRVWYFRTFSPYNMPKRRLSAIPQARLGHRTRGHGLQLLALTRLEKPPDVHLQKVRTGHSISICCAEYITSRNFGGREEASRVPVGRMYCQETPMHRKHICGYHSPVSGEEQWRVGGSGVREAATGWRLTRPRGYGVAGTYLVIAPW